MKKFFKVLLIIIIIFSCLTFILFHLDKWKAEKKINIVSKYATTINDIKIPNNTKIVALGEATHGNKEFQELKLDILKNVVKNNNVRTFALEVDYGDGLLVNDYIHGRSNYTLDEIVNLLSFDIYKTTQIGNLIEWMKTYNDDSNNTEKLSFYGFDLQNPQNDTKYIINYLNNNGYEKYDSNNTLKALTTDYIKLEDSETKKAIELLKQINNEIKSDNSLDYKLVSHAIKNVLNCIDYFSNTDMNDYVSFNNKRDSYMKENVDFITSLSNNNVMISGHNGHVAIRDINYTNMGSLLEKEYKEQYYVIGTDYFNTLCNIGDGTNRSNHHFNSADKLAYQAKYMENKNYYLDFTSLDKNSEIYNLVNSQMYNGDIGEGYNLFMSLFPFSTRKKINPTKFYNGMIYFYNVTPIELKK